MSAAYLERFRGVFREGKLVDYDSRRRVVVFTLETLGVRQSP